VCAVKCDCVRMPVCMCMCDFSCRVVDVW
jgi:hypothetical protein